MAKLRGERSAAFPHLSVCLQYRRGGKERGLLSPLHLWPKPRGDTSAAFFHLSVCDQNRRVKGTRSSFISRFMAKTEKRKERDLLPSPLGLWPKGGERSAACFPSRFVAKIEGMKGARPSFPSRFVVRNEGGKECCLLSPLDLWRKPSSERSAAFLHLSVCGQDRGVKGERPFFLSRFMAKIEEAKESGLPSPLGLWPKPRGERNAAFLRLSVCGQKGVKGARLVSPLDLWPKSRG